MFAQPLARWCTAGLRPNAVAIVLFITTAQFAVLTVLMVPLAKQFED